MQNKNEIYFATELKRMLMDENKESFDTLLQEREEYIKKLPNNEEKRRIVLYFLQSDVELNEIALKKKNDIQQLLLTQNEQMKAIKKYNEF